MSKPRKPDYLLKAMNKTTGEKTGRIGAAWNNEDGSINIVLDLCVQLSGDKDIELRLFPNSKE